MRYIFAAWMLPLVAFWGWFGLSYYDVNFGYLMLSRQVHDLYFQICGEIMGVDPATVPWFIAKAFVFDAVILFAIWGLRRRREIAAWVRARRERYASPAASVEAGSSPSV